MKQLFIALFAILMLGGCVEESFYTTDYYPTRLPYYYGYYPRYWQGHNSYRKHRPRYTTTTIARPAISRPSLPAVSGRSSYSGPIATSSKPSITINPRSRPLIQPSKKLMPGMKSIEKNGTS